MWQVDLKQHILPDIDISDQLHSINCSGRHADYTWMDHHLQYILMWDAYRNLIFKEVHHIISKEKCMGRYLSITRRIIISKSTQIPPREKMEYEPHPYQIQNIISIC